jgi:outer membrane immunogenic protein
MAPMVRHNLAFLLNRVARGGDTACGFNHIGKPGVTKFCVESQSANGGLQDADACEAGNTMMKKLVAACFALGALVTAQCAAAADLSLAPLYKAPPPQVTQVYNWTGFYIGANGGGGWGHSYWDANATGMHLSGGQVGGTAGYNWQFGNAVLGLEGDLDWSNLKGSATSTLCPAGCSTSDSWLSTVRGRAGYAFGTVLPYVTGGLAVGDIRAATPGFAGDSTTNAGWTVGAGLEVALPGNWSAKAEYLHVDLGRLNCGLDCGISPTDNVSMHDDIVRAGLNYHFGWNK